MRLSLDEQFESAGIVFWGTMFERADDPHHDRRYQATFAVKRVFKGTVDDTEIVTTSKFGTACGAALQVGRSFLVYGSLADDDTIGTSRCSGTHQLAYEPIVFGLQGLSQLDDYSGNTKRVRSAKRSLKRLKAAVAKKANRARRVCARSSSSIGPFRGMSVDFNLWPNGDYFAHSSSQRTSGMSNDRQRKGIDSFAGCVVEQSNEGDDVESFPGRTMKIRHTFSREDATSRWSTKQSVHHRHTSQLHDYFDSLERVPRREATSKLRLRIVQISDLLASKPSPAYNSKRALELAKSQRALGDCSAVLETIETWPEYFEEVEDRDQLGRLRADCHMAVGEYEQALEMVEGLSPDAPMHISLDTVRGDILRFALDRARRTKPKGAGEEDGLDSRDEPSFASVWLTDDGKGRLRRHHGIKQVLRLVGSDHSDTPIVLEALGDLLGRRSGDIPLSHRRTAALAYLRAARNVEPKAAARYRRLAAQVLSGTDDEVAELEAQLDESLRQARAGLKRSNREEEVVYKEKLAGFQAFIAGRDAETNAPAKTPDTPGPGGADGAAASDEHQRDDMADGSDSADEQGANPGYLLLGAISLGLLSLILVGAAFLRDES
jgi:hypothetical protein